MSDSIDIVRRVHHIFKIGLGAFVPLPAFFKILDGYCLYSVISPGVTMTSSDVEIVNWSSSKDGDAKTSRLVTSREEKVIADEYRGSAVRRIYRF